MNLGLPELLVIFAVALLVFGPRRLPELAKGLGKGIRDFKKALGGEDDTKDVTDTTPKRPEAVPPAQQQEVVNKETNTKDPVS